MRDRYSDDLKIAALNMLKTGHFKEEVCKDFNIALSTLNRWVKQKKETGSVLSKPRSGGPSCKITNLKIFKIFIDKNPEKTLVELAILWGNISSASIYRAIRKLGYTFKKKVFYTKKDLKQREKYIWKK